MTGVSAEPRGGHNLYRDRHWLVAPIEGAVFPNRCVKTNQPVEAASYPFEADLLWQQVQVPESGGQMAANAVARALFGAAGGAALSLALKRRLRYLIGLSADRQAKAKRFFYLGLGLTAAGPPLSIALAATCAALTAPAPGAPPNLPLTIAGGAVGFVVFIVGIVLFGISTMGILRVMRSDGQYVWFEGAHGDFLDTLPESPAKWKPLFG